MVKQIHISVLMFFLLVFLINIISLIPNSTFGKTPSEIKEVKDRREIRSEVKRELTYWSNQVKIKPSFAPSWVMLSIANWRLGFKNEALLQIDKSLALDPNNKIFQDLKKLYEGENLGR